MFEFVNFGAEKLQLFLLILLRISGLMISAPIISDRSIPTPINAGLAILLSLILVAALPSMTVPATDSFVMLCILVARELLIGLAIGFVFQILFYAVQAAGSLVGYQIGFSMANIIDPSTQSEQSVLSQFWFLLASLIFLIINGHHLVISGLVDSFKVIPAGAVMFNAAAGDLFIKATALVLVLALKLAAPVIATLFLVDIALAIVSRVMPTMNVFMVGFSVKVGTGIAIMAVSLPMFAYVFNASLFNLNGSLSELLTVLGGK